MSRWNAARSAGRMAFRGPSREELMLLARRISRKPWNTPGTDKSFVYFAADDWAAYFRGLNR